MQIACKLLRNVRLETIRQTAARGPGGVMNIHERAAYLALIGPTPTGSNDELAVMAESGISPDCIPRAVRQLPAANHKRLHSTSS